jgi:cytochrome b subunit of formate dehydrogenase
MNKNEVHSEKVLRFRKSERWFHWAISIPFIVCYVTAMVLVVFYNTNPLLPYRDVFSWIHRISGVCLIILPPLVILTGRSDFRLFFIISGRPGSGPWRISNSCS